MQNAIDNVLTELATLLGPLSPFTKAVVPAALSLATAAVAAIFALVNGGPINSTALITAGAGLLLSLIVFELPNIEKVAPTPAPAPTLARTKKAAPTPAPRRRKP